MFSRLKFSLSYQGHLFCKYCLNTAWSWVFTYFGGFILQSHSGIINLGLFWIFDWCKLALICLIMRTEVEIHLTALEDALWSCNDCKIYEIRSGMHLFDRTVELLLTLQLWLFFISIFNTSWETFWQCFTVILYYYTTKTCLNCFFWAAGYGLNMIFQVYQQILRWWYEWGFVGITRTTLSMTKYF